MTFIRGCHFDRGEKPLFGTRSESTAHCSIRSVQFRASSKNHLLRFLWAGRYRRYPRVWPFSLSGWFPQCSQVETWLLSDSRTAHQERSDVKLVGDLQRLGIVGAQVVLDNLYRPGPSISAFKKLVVSSWCFSTNDFVVPMPPRG